MLDLPATGRIHLSSVGQACVQTFLLMDKLFSGHAALFVYIKTSMIGCIKTNELGSK